MLYGVALILLYIIGFFKYDIRRYHLFRLYTLNVLHQPVVRDSKTQPFHSFRRLLASQLHIVIEGCPSCDRVQVIALDSNLNQRMVLFNDLLSE